MVSRRAQLWCTAFRATHCTSVSPARLANAFDCAGREGFSQYASVSAIGVCTGIGVLRRSKVQTERDHLTTPIVDSNRRLQVARLLGRLANVMELFNNKSAVYVAALQVDLGNQVGSVWIMGESRLRTQCL